LLYTAKASGSVNSMNLPAYQRTGSQHRWQLVRSRWVWNTQYSAITTYPQHSRWPDTLTTFQPSWDLLQFQVFNANM